MKKKNKKKFFLLLCKYLGNNFEVFFLFLGGNINFRPWSIKERKKEYLKSNHKHLKKETEFDSKTQFILQRYIKDTKDGSIELEWEKKFYSRSFLPIYQKNQFLEIVNKISVVQCLKQD